MIARESRHDCAIEKFKAANPTLLEEIQALSPKEQQQQIEWAFEDEAESRGLEPWELALELIARSPEELHAMRIETHREVADALGMSWEEYCGFNEISE
ncbi:DUF6388 family protein [Pseudomonas akapageensis]|uniref:DUF6388 family protein n=1 Tax=Pseudomonas akapageensis TaxID=2609961 RepID=UPI00140E36F0|nr:DUF6388 family protein [Pseudomonas akapageensis]